MIFLTASAYKMAIAGKMPPVAYLTWLDKYTLWNFFLIIAMALQSRTLSQFGPDSPNPIDKYDSICLSILSVCWVGIHVWFVGRAVHMHCLNGQKLRDTNILAEFGDETSIKVQAAETMGAKVRRKVSLTRQSRSNCSPRSNVSTASAGVM